MFGQVNKTDLREYRDGDVLYVFLSNGEQFRGIVYIRDYQRPDDAQDYVTLEVFDIEYWSSDREKPRSIILSQLMDDSGSYPVSITSCYNEGGELQYMSGVSAIYRGSLRNPIVHMGHKIGRFVDEKILH